MAISAMSNTTGPADEGTLDQCALVNFTSLSYTPAIPPWHSGICASCAEPGSQYRCP